MNDPAPAHVRRWWRSGRFWTVSAASLAGLCLTVILVWSANDASFRPSLLQWEVSLGLRKLLVTGPPLDGDWGLNDPNRTLRWDGLGKRVMALHMLVWTGVVATALLAVLAFRPPRGRRILAVVGLIVGWGLLCATQTRVDDWRARRQIAAIFPRIEAAGLALNRDWPTQSGRIPPDIDVWVDAEKYPNVVTLRGRRERYPFQEAIGLLIKRGPSGVIYFDLAASYVMTVEYHPNGTQPAAHKAGFGYGSPPVAAYYRLKENWYLVRYGG